MSILSKYPHSLIYDVIFQDRIEPRASVYQEFIALQKHFLIFIKLIKPFVSYNNDKKGNFVYENVFFLHLYAVCYLYRVMNNTILIINQLLITNYSCVIRNIRISVWRRQTTRLFVCDRSEVQFHMPLHQSDLCRQWLSTTRIYIRN